MIFQMSLDSCTAYVLFVGQKYELFIIFVSMRKKIALLLVLLAAALSSRAQTGTWSGKIDVQGTKLTLVFHLDDEKPSMDSPDQGAKGIPIEVERSSTGSVTIKIPSAGATYEGLWMVKKMVGTFNQAGTSFPLTLTPGAPKVNRPQTPAGPFPYTQEEVTFTNGEAVLSGTLTLPENYTRETPALIMVTGSGLQNRDEEIFEHKPFAVIADAFARAGIATLRYDDRGIGKSEGDVVNCTTEDFKEDALAGVKLLKDRFDRVGVLGHSEGGSIAMMLAAEGHADFIISLAGGVVSGAEVLIWQNSLALSEAGMPEETVRNYLSLLKEAFDACVSDKPMPSAAGRGLPDALAHMVIVSQRLTMQAAHEVYGRFQLIEGTDRFICRCLKISVTISHREVFTQSLDVHQLSPFSSSSHDRTDSRFFQL